MAPEAVIQRRLFYGLLQWKSIPSTQLYDFLATVFFATYCGAMSV
jgi:hypothetical protein